MNNAQKYFTQQLSNKEFIDTVDAISEQVDIEWELEMVKTQIKNNTDKATIIKEIEKLQKFIHNTMFASTSSVPSSA